MSSDKRGIHGIWASRWTFVLAASGSAVGLGNIWKFPYITGEYGGGAFVLVYLLCIISVGIPIMMAEAMIGRRTRMSPINAMRQLTKSSKAPKIFASLGWMGAVTGFLILSFYSVIAGWAIYYTVEVFSGTFTGASADQVATTFSDLLANTGLLTLCHTVFMLSVGVVIAKGVHRGLENSLRVLMPLLFVMLLILLGYSLTTPGFVEGWNFLFKFEPEKLTTEAILVALGHSFFTLSLGMGAIMAYGAYMPAGSPLARTIITVGILDTVVALVAGLIIFPIVFSNGLEPGAGPGLMFQTLPLAFGGLIAGSIIGGVFFSLVVIAAWSSAISIAEPVVAWAVERGISRARATTTVCTLAWVLGIATVLSFNDWSDQQFFVEATSTSADGQVVASEWHFFANTTELKAQLDSKAQIQAQVDESQPQGMDVTHTITGKTVFDMLDFLTTNLLMPLGGVMIAIFVGWFMSWRAVTDEARLSPAILQVWKVMIRVISPAAVALVFINGLL